MLCRVPVWNHINFTMIKFSLTYFWCIFNLGIFWTIRKFAKLKCYQICNSGKPREDLQHMYVLANPVRYICFIFIADMLIAVLSQFLVTWQLWCMRLQATIKGSCELTRECRWHLSNWNFKRHNSTLKAKRNYIFARFLTKNNHSCTKMIVNLFPAHWITVILMRRLKNFHVLFYSKFMPTTN